MDQWYRRLLGKTTGPFYDDGALQIAITVEVRGSQARVTFFFRNQSPASLSAFSLAVEDTAGLTRFELGPGVNSIAALSTATNVQQSLMLECMKPVAGNITVTVNYNDSLQGIRKHVLPLPINVTTFNDPLSTLSGADFVQRWEALSSPSLQAQEILYPSSPVNPPEILDAMTSVLRFGYVTGVPDESEFIIHGAASLRTGATAPGNNNKISIGCLVKVEMNVQTNAMRVTVRTLHPAATAAIMATAKQLLQ